MVEPASIRPSNLEKQGPTAAIRDLRKRKYKEITELFAQIERKAHWVFPNARQEAVVIDLDDEKLVQSALDGGTDFSCDKIVIGQTGKN